MKTLKDAKIGETVKVVKLTGEGPVKRRIMDMGITKGTKCSSVRSRLSETPWRSPSAATSFRSAKRIPK